MYDDQPPGPGEKRLRAMRVPLIRTKFNSIFGAHLDSDLDRFGDFVTSFCRDWQSCEFPSNGMRHS